ncbi:hypothetical protein Tco_0261014 [Tanacetum coccineum]
MDHICEEVSSLHSKLRDMESSIVQQVLTEIKSSLPALVTNTLKEQLPNFLSDALKDTLPRLLKDSIKSSVSKSIVKELPHVEAQVQKNLQDQLPNLLLKPLYKEFNAFNKLEKAAKVFKKANVEGEKWEKNNHAEEKDAQHPDQTKGEQNLGANTADIKSEGNVSMKDDSDDDDLDKKPLEKRFKIVTPIPNPILLNTFAPEHLLKPEEQQKSLHDFTDQLFGTTSSKFSPTLPREPTPPRDPAKGKEVAIVKEQGN